MDYRKIIEDLADVDTLADEELRYAAVAFIRELFQKKMELTSELTLAKRCLAENEEAYAAVKRELEIANRVNCALFPFIPGAKFNTSVEDPATMYLDLPEGPRLVFHGDKYTGYVAEVGE